jgi:Trk-type K+ transport system membrane component
MSAEYDITEKIIEINSLAGGWIGFMILVSAFLIIMISLKNYETKRAFAAASFICTIISILLNYINMVQIYFTVVLICMSVGSWIMIKSEDS